MGCTEQHSQTCTISATLRNVVKISLACQTRYNPPQSKAMRNANGKPIPPCQGNMRLRPFFLFSFV
ncbi:hypothetical protein M419DRAFT_118105 [Trichoderma reesei RUT C-30]|uniref:Uncharacterized protein n=1 Tax=Hypocrea jecorina (strain ATCC 56765 / BCRC 32924 / NRRL 11460 / Rut C-30) TaxID=1344414 RepID=A0A024SFE0_HYPJR|nr:hypothetical protein M419DRAFT_118105 [Trichoderma reesei RUT C-30]